MFSDNDLVLMERPVFAKLAMHMADGSLQNTVMWFRADAGILRMIAPEASMKARNLSRDPQCAVVIDDPANGYRYLEIRGRAEVVRDDTAARRELRRIAARYIAADADAYVDALSSEPRVMIVIHPERVRSHSGTTPAPRAD